MSEEIYQVLKEILPELEAKIRTELASEYQAKLQQVQHQCEQEVTAIIAEKQRQLKQIYVSKSQSHDSDLQLTRRISMLENQRTNWLALENQYQTTINQMAQRIVEYEEILSEVSETPMNSARSNYQTNRKAQNKLSNISSIQAPSNKLVRDLKEGLKSQKKTSQVNKSKRTILQRTKVPQQENNQKLQEYLNLVEHSDCDENGNKGDKGNKGEKGSKNNKGDLDDKSDKFDQDMGENDSLEQRIEEDQCQQNKQHYRSVLSPPKNELSSLRTGKQNKKNSIFWNQDKKKHLLSLIKFQ